MLLGPAHLLGLTFWVASPNHFRTPTTQQTSATTTGTTTTEDKAANKTATLVPEKEVVGHGKTISRTTDVHAPDGTTITIIDEKW
eukprot:840045-Prorocentrum_minimum.AAC.2